MPYKWIKREYTVTEYFLVTTDETVDDKKLIDMFYEDPDAQYTDPTTDKISESVMSVSKNDPSDRELSEYAKHGIELGE